MLNNAARRHAVLTMIGGAFLAVALTLDDIAPDYVGIAVIIPVLLGFGVLEIYGQYGESYGSAGRAGVILTSCGLGSLLIAILLFAVTPPGLLAVVLVAVPGMTGIVTLALGSALLATVLYRLGVIHIPTAVLLGFGVPLIPLVGAFLAAIAGPVTTGLSGAPYGIGWILVGYRLWQPAGTDHAASISEQSQAITISPQLVFAAIVGGAFVLLSTGRFLPLGPLSGTPWVNQSLALDVGHFTLGIAGVGVAVSRERRLARTYNRIVGLLSLSIVILAFLRVFQDVRLLRWLVVTRLDLNMPDIILHLPAGLVLVIVGFLVNGGKETGIRSESK